MESGSWLGSSLTDGLPPPLKKRLPSSGNRIDAVPALLVSRDADASDEGALGDHNVCDVCRAAIPMTVNVDDKSYR